MPRSTFLRDDGTENAVCTIMLTPSDLDTSGSTAASGAFFGDSGSQNWLLGDQFL